eukprot:gene30874-37310_t
MSLRAVFIGVTIGFALYGIYFTLDNQRVAEPAPLHTTAKPIQLSVTVHPNEQLELKVPPKKLSSEAPPSLIPPVNVPAVPPPVSSLPSSKFVKATKENDPSLATAISDRELTAITSSPLAGKQICLRMMKKYQVLPGSSWGALTAPLQQKWTSMNCDQHVKHKVTIDHAETTTTSHTDTSSEDAVPKLLHTDGLMNIPDSQRKWCHSTRVKYHVQPMKSWGSMSPTTIEEWKKNRCDIVFTIQRMARKPVSNCTSYSGPTKDLPMIAIMAASTTRNIKEPSPTTMALFTYLLPSLMRTLDCGFRYEYYLGYDQGDVYYDDASGMEEVKAWINKNIKQPLARRQISFEFRAVRVHNTVQKPGPVFLEMARAAYKNGAAYFYRINDDTELLGTWPRAFVRTLESLGSPYGVVGPLCNQGNERILTHDFVHRVHMDVFEMNYYPPELTDWWMDDWISFVYGQTRTFRAKHVPVIHHTGAHGQRYQVDKSHEQLLGTLVRLGSQKIRQYMLKHGVNDTVLKKFDRDNFALNFVHRDIPFQIKEKLHA